MAPSTPNQNRLQRVRAGRRRTAVLAAIAAVLLVAVDYLTGGMTRSWVHGSAQLRVTSEPAGATVSIDGVVKGTTPLVLDVEPGSRVLLVEHPYHPNHVEELQLTRNQQVDRTLALDPAFGSLHIVSNPKGASIQLDGTAQPGVTPLEINPIPAGQHEVILRLPNRTTRRLNAEVLPDTRAELSADLERALTGTLIVKVTPTDASVVLIDEFDQRHAPGTPVAVGRYTLRVTRDGYRDDEQFVRIAVGEHVKDVALTQLRGSLQVDVKPASARVTLDWIQDRQRRRAEYVAGIELPAGPVTIDARAPGYRPERRTVSIQDGPRAVAISLHRVDARAGDRIQDTLKGGGQAPAMVVVPAGRFTPPGAPDGQRRLPATTFELPFAIGINEVTRADWMRYTDATGQSLAAARDDETPAHPVLRMSFEEALRYAQWLSTQTGERYRLPTEAEWEYAARAGATTPYPGAGIDTICQHANVADAELATRFRSWETVPCNDGYLRSAPVGQYAANAWGLYDVIGNAAEWTTTCWDAPSASSGDSGAACGSRAVRGGSWDTAGAGLTLSAGEPGSSGSDDRGLRLLREL